MNEVMSFIFAELGMDCLRGQSRWVSWNQSYFDGGRKWKMKNGGNGDFDGEIWGLTVKIKVLSADLFD